MFRKECFCDTNSYSLMKITFKSVFRFVFNNKTVFYFAWCSILEKNVKKLLRNFEYLKSQKAKKTLSTEARPKVLIKKRCVA